ncbi:MAG: photosystem P840 reaction-center cytochrome c-551 [Betaproteobacteria bacterium]|nr:photosystem P840 reaction-center cytochrome c-551 [Betaproteobacteria bacterium]
MKSLTIFSILGLAALSASAVAGEDKIQLKHGPGSELVAAHCVMCHSLDMIQINSPFLKRGQWEATVTKMKKVMGAPINDEDTAKIVDYLTKYYGAETPPAPPAAAKN